MFVGHHCLHDMYYILHYDISVDNLMIRKKGEQTYGVLNDFDLSSWTTSSTEDVVASGLRRARTGTWPFMAADLLKDPPPPHLYRHDLESFFYVIVWLTSLNDQGETPMQEWQTMNKKALSDKKAGFMLLGEGFKLQGQFDQLSLNIVDIKASIRNGFFAQVVYMEECKRAIAKGDIVRSFNNFTLDGHVTVQIFRDALRPVAA